MSNSPSQWDAPLDSQSAYRRHLQHLDDLLNHGGTLSGHERNCAFLRIPGDGAEQSPRFATASSVFGFDFVDDGRAIGLTDWDDDGDVDVWLANRTAPRIRVLENAQSTQSGFVKFHLIGVASNRDGIGARVTLFNRDRSMVQTKTLRAGEGFLSQSSKELHFGLGQIENERLTVEIRWPNGATQRFHGVVPNCRYRVTQGSDTLDRLTRRNLAFNVVRAPVEADRGNSESTLQASSTALLFLASRIPVPSLRYRTPEPVDEDEKTIRDLPVGQGRPVVVNLWASWCLPCLKELQDLKKGSARLQQLDVGLFCLSVDGIRTQGISTEDAETNRGRAAQRMESGDWPFTVGFATDKLVARLQLVEDELFSQKRNIGVPTSYLIDGEGRLAAIYRGPIDLNRLERDVANLGARGAAIDEAALPFRGRWFQRRESVLSLRLARQLAKSGDYEDAASYLIEHSNLLKTRPGFANLCGQLGSRLVREDQHAKRIELFRLAVAVEPANIPAVNNLAWYLASRSSATKSDIEESLRWAKQAAVLSKYRVLPVLHTLAKVQQKAGDTKSAKATLQHALRLARQKDDQQAVEKIQQQLDALR